MRLPLPPSLMRLVIEQPGRKIRLWLPLFLFWPIAFLVAVIGLPFLLVFALVQQRSGFWRIPATVWELLLAVRGTCIHVQNKDQTVLLKIM